MYTQRPFSSLTVTCARKTTVTCTHQRSHGHMYTQARSYAHAKRRSHVHTSDTTVTCTHHYSGYGVGWSDNVHVSVHAQARQPYHLSGCSAGTGTTQRCVPLNYCLYFTSSLKLPPLCATKLLSPFYFFIKTYPPLRYTKLLSPLYFFI